MPYRLHYAPDNASLIVRLALEAMGLPYDTVLVDRGTQGQTSPAYLALNPNGLIPTLETPDGPIFETGAILLWLADRHGGLFPAPGHPDRANALKWLFWLSNTLHPAERILFYPDKHIDRAHTAALLARTQDRIGDMLDILAPCDWLEEEAGMLHFYLGPLLRWPALYGPGGDWFDLTRWPRLLAFAQALDTHPATLAAIEAEGLGPTPFSAPRPPNPPEGSAT